MVHQIEKDLIGCHLLEIHIVVNRRWLLPQAIQRRLALLNRDSYGSLNECPLAPKLLRNDYLLHISIHLFLQPVFSPLSRSQLAGPILPGEVPALHTNELLKWSKIINWLG